jgi:hypothetical protein
LTALATTVAFACGLIAGLPQIVRMVRGRNSSSQSAVGWAIGANGAAATAYVGVAEGAAPVVYGPSIAATLVATAGLAVTVYYSEPGLAPARGVLAVVPSSARRRARMIARRIAARRLSPAPESGN